MKIAHLFILFLVAWLVFVPQTANAQTLDPSFNANVFTAGLVLDAAVQPDGKILVGGRFVNVGGQVGDGIARLNADGTLDTTFNTGTGISEALVYSIAVQPDGKILIVGTFTNFNGTTVGGIARLNADGSLDTTFNTAGVSGNPTIYAVAVQPDGKILVGGTFTSFGGSPINRIVRLNADGSIDTTFNVGTGASSTVYDFEVLSGGKILVSGNFSTFNGTTAGRIVRLNANGTVDTTFTTGTGASSSVWSIALQSDGKIVIGGAFATFNGTARPRVARLNADGTVDTTFATGSGVNNGTVYGVGVQSDGKIVAGGSFTTAGGSTPRRNLARFNADGTLDAAYDPSPDAQVRSVDILAADKSLIGGEFANIAGTGKASLAVLNTDGTADSTFTARIYDTATVRALLQQPDGKILAAGGGFDFANFTARRGIARFNLDGTLDATFDPGTGTDGFIYDLALQTDGKVLVVGTFTSFNAATVGRIVRLNADGSIDTTFNSGGTGAGGTIFTVAVQTDGKIVIGGSFTNYNGTAINRIARLNADGTLDSTFNPGTGTNASVNEVQILSGGKILIGGIFSMVNSTARDSIARLNADGSLDTAFVGAGTVGGSLQTFEVLSDGKILIGGSFTTIGGVARLRLARLNADGTLDTTFDPGTALGNGFVYDIILQNDGKIIVGGSFDDVGGNPDRDVIARFNADGTLDTSFNATSQDTIFALLKQADGKIVAGGNFNFFNGVRKAGIARFTIDAPTIRKTPFDFDGDGKADISVFRPSNGSWYINRSTNGFTGVQFGQNGDLLVPADYDGDGKTDVATARAYASDGTLFFYILQSGNNTIRQVQFGQNTDIPIPADFDGDGKADLAVFREAAQVGDANFFVYFPSSNTTGTPSRDFVVIRFGTRGDVPVVGDYDGDGTADAAVVRKGGANDPITWFVRVSDTQFNTTSFGSATDTLVPADYDGDGKTDIAVFRPGNGFWYRLNSSNGGFNAAQFGQSGDITVPADYDGDGKADLAVFRNGIWYAQQSTSGFFAFNFGAATDKPVPAAYVR